MVAAPTSTTNAAPLSNPTIESFELAIPPLSTVAAINQRRLQAQQQQIQSNPLESQPQTQQGSIKVPRIWTGLWQLSSPAWGTAPAARIRREMRKHVDKGFTAFDMVGINSIQHQPGSFKN
ncbi:hypothetical protein FRC14_005995 [Serendipita sp. 396]|nr:hypothetical protein FRC14_005995 [Serendipita sp. 396]KAG8787353.1 hypothetical protein FRC15_009459 [Serendipita sp. 397]KAG8796917.1 hypothetical protein FRC16_009387 [Serendipita sp. 398]KAG8822828.1 hypothetical protein FRC19_005163 [Serendipita sp. 401]KAG8837145.1 hypothetical protein FRC18_009954 [Serendipita sp. 400]KAG8861105.1 hypothetical protein FRB91_009905 [Serendipita sp. 411]KAG8870539.1 hypothetical protein FRC20_011721 [Serendipita sp. 405]KAG9056529.1 hypothetical prot